MRVPLLSAGAMVLGLTCGCAMPALPDPASGSASPSAAASPDAPSTSPEAPQRTSRESSATSRGGPYGWLDDDTPSPTYVVAFVRGLSVDEVLSTLGDVREDAGPMSIEAARSRALDLTSPRTYDGPPVVQVDELQGGVVVYAPYAVEVSGRVAALSRGGSAAAFVTTVELDTSVRVARDGKVVREFDPLFHRARSARALPEERGLRWRGRRFLASSWQVLGRVTDIEVGRSWLLDRRHPTYVLDG